MKRFLVRAVGVILLGGSIVMLAMFWSDSRSGLSPTYIKGVQHDVAVQEEHLKSLQAQHASQDEIDATMLAVADRMDELAGAYREQNRHTEYWRKFYAIIGAAALLGLVALYFGFRKPRGAVTASR